MDSIREMLRAAPVIPVLAIDELEQAVPLAQALVQGGLPILEVTLRTDCALDAISRIRECVPGAVVGVGTLLSAATLDDAKGAGSQFVVCPGATRPVIERALELEVPLLPGVATASEVMLCLEHGLENLKFFPAEAAGGSAVLKALYGPFPQVVFCPTGGISPSNMSQYLTLPNVLTVGGSWMVPKEMLATGDWSGIQALAADATQKALACDDDGNSQVDHARAVPGQG
ncbi:MAG: bifunctional 4-hydroxy-2-oxoglutarate aldolase/2-dehydro-3-deoxy-phosphogluconate aldolase [Pseudomonadota bacterium]